MDLGEDSFAALEREIKEELNLTCEAVKRFDISDTALAEQVIRLETIVCVLANNPNLSLSLIHISEPTRPY